MQVLPLKTALGLVLLIVVFATLPLFAHAQTDLQSAIRVAIMSDPRSAGMSSAQIDGVVAALSQSAQKQGITPADIAWRPETPTPMTPAQFCAPYPAFFCFLTGAFGFYGPTYLIPIWLAVTSLLFLLVNALQHHHRRIAIEA